MIKIDCMTWLKDQFMQFFNNKDDGLIESLHDKELQELDSFRKT